MERNPTRRRRRRSRFAAHFTCVCKHVHRKERNSQHLMQDGQSLGIAATTIVGCLVYAASQGILAFILNLGNREQSTMGMIRSSFSFLLETGCGIYIAQNYNVPNIKKLISTWMFVANHIEETYRKPNKDVIRRYRETMADDT
ncbi:unnamed protein product [Musa banksii]